MECTDKRKRSLPDIQDLVATIDLDENGNMKLTSKLVQCFFFPSGTWAYFSRLMLRATRC